MSGGIPHIINALKGALEATLAEPICLLTRTLTNLAHYRSPLLKLYFMELSYSETVLDVVRTMFGVLLRQEPSTQSEQDAIAAGIEFLKVLIGANTMVDEDKAIGTS